VEEYILKPSGLILVVCVLLAGCSDLAPFTGVVKGNRKYAGGDYQGANIAYIEAGRSGKYEHWIAYNLGTVYYALGEAEAAEREWQIASGTQDETLLYNVYFNLGVLYYDRGLYAFAYERFRNALEINPKGVQAKLNLELSMEKLEVKDQKSQPSGDSATNGQSRGEIERILNYLRRMEGEVWESTENLDYDPLPRDL
jgi:tetratricopeptide (TPR) repeat protein